MKGASSELVCLGRGLQGMEAHVASAVIVCCFAGRISVFAEPSAETRAAGLKGGEWVYATHDLADTTEVLGSIQERMSTGAHSATMLFRQLTVAGGLHFSQS